MNILAVDIQASQNGCFTLRVALVLLCDEADRKCAVLRIHNLCFFCLPRPVGVSYGAVRVCFTRQASGFGTCKTSCAVLRHLTTFFVTYREFANIGSGLVQIRCRKASFFGGIRHRQTSPKIVESRRQVFVHQRVDGAIQRKRASCKNSLFSIWRYGRDK